MRVYNAEERKLRQLAASYGFDSPAEYLRDHIARTPPKSAKPTKPAEPTEPKDVADPIDSTAPFSRAA